MATTDVVNPTDYSNASSADVALSLVNAGGWYVGDSWHTIYPDWQPYVPHHHHYPLAPQVVHTPVLVASPSEEKPHETVQRAIKEIAKAARDLQRSAEQMGVPLDARTLEEAIASKLRDAL